MNRFFSCLVIVGCLQFAAIAQEQKTLADGNLKLADCVSSMDINFEDSTSMGYQHWFIDKDFLDGRTVKLSVVPANSRKHDPHTHVEDEIFFILEGSAQIYLNGETRIVGPYTSFYCPANSVHGISNAGETELKYLVLKTYQQQKD